MKLVHSIFLKFIIINTLILSDVSNASNSSCSCQKMTKQIALLKMFENKSPKDMVLIPEGVFMMGAELFDKESKTDEKPQHEVKVKDFYLDVTPVTNKQFALFVEKTQYKTLAEKPVDWDSLKQQLPEGTPKPAPEQLAPGSLIFSPEHSITDLSNPSLWWKWGTGINWQHPLKAGESHLGEQHPVVHISWFDASAYCKWRGKRLPTEAEWERAARGGLKHSIYPWGNEDIDTGTVKANTWQGSFPNQNTLRDKYYWTSPVRSFPANPYGLFDMAGNVWEWTSDLYDANYYDSLKKSGIALNPHNTKISYDPEEPNVKKYILRGGSFLCNRSYCAGYRVSARMKSSPDTSLVNTGFRCAKNK